MLTIIFTLYFQIWDRRSKRILMEEMEWWKDVLPGMMSDEETLDDQSLKCMRPDWRGTKFNEFMDRLDEHVYRASKHTRKIRVLGSPVKCPVPGTVKEWMTKDYNQ